MTEISHWFVICTHLKQEKLAKFHLGRQKFETYLPLYLPDHPKANVHPLFVGKMFVRLDLGNERWLPVLSTIGVRDVIRGSEKRPIAVQDWIIDEIRGREVNGLVQLDAKIETGPFKRGDKVQLKHSPLTAIFQERVDARRAAVLLSLLHTDSRVIVPFSKLSLAS